MKYLWPLLLALFAFPAFATEINVESDALDELIEERVEAAWTAACLLRGTNCSKIPRPIVIFSNEMANPDWQGGYKNGSGIIYVRLSYQVDPYAMVVMTHEMIHFLQFIETGIRIATVTQRCAFEKEAFEADDRLAKTLGLDTHPDAFTWSEVVTQYGCSPEQLKR